MNIRKAFDNFASNDNKYQIRIENYLLPYKENPPQGSDDSVAKIDQYSQGFIAYDSAEVLIKSPQIAVWDYLDKGQVARLMALQKKRDVRQFIDTTLAAKYPKGFPRIVFRELMYSVMKYCRASRYTLEQTAAILSQFYLTHLYFTSSLNLGPEKLYQYFKELQLHHSLPFPPHSTKLFILEEVKSIMVFFCKIYLRNLPIIRCLTLPNFSICACYKVPPELPLGKAKKKDKGKKNKGKGKKSKK